MNELEFSAKIDFGKKLDSACHNKIYREIETAIKKIANDNGGAFNEFKVTDASPKCPRIECRQIDNAG